MLTVQRATNPKAVDYDCIANYQLLVFIGIFITLEELYKLAVSNQHLYLFNPNGPTNCRSWSWPRLANSLFKMKKDIYIAAVQVVARLWILMLDDSVTSLKNLVQFWWNVITNNPKLFYQPSNLGQMSLERFTLVPEVTSLAAWPRSQFTRWQT